MSSTSDPHAAQLESLARQTGFSTEAVETMMDRVIAGGGRMAQFDHREFGGAGQWMQGGMLMTSDPSNHDLERRIAHLCEALAEWVAREPRARQSASYQSQSQTAGGVTHAQDSRSREAAAVGQRARSWWPASLGSPDSTGMQDEMRYAWFGDARRLVVDENGKVTTYDTGRHRIAGVAQQQGGQRTVSFTSQDGLVDLDRLPVVDANEAAVPAARAAAGDSSATDPFVALEKLAALHARGILDDDELAAKKAELLKRI